MAFAIFLYSLLFTLYSLLFIFVKIRVIRGLQPIYI